MIPEIEEDDPGIYFCIKASVQENRFFTVCVWIPLALALVKFCVKKAIQTEICHFF